MSEQSNNHKELYQQAQQKVMDNIPLNQQDKEHGRWTGTPAKDNSLEKKKCFNCGSMDHLAKDKKCPGNSQVQEDKERDRQEDLPKGRG